MFLLCFLFFADTNECSSAAKHECIVNAICINTNGSYYCECDTGYSGDGLTQCSGVFSCMA